MLEFRTAWPGNSNRGHEFANTADCDSAKGNGILGCELPVDDRLAIIEYLDEVRPQPPLLPAVPVARARVRALARASLARAEAAGLGSLQWAAGSAAQVLTTGGVPRASRVGRFLELLDAGVAECGPLTSICERKPDLCQQTWRDVSSGGRWCTGAHSERWITYVERGDACGELSFLRVSGVDGWTIYYFDRSGALVGLAARGGMGHRSCAGRVPSPETACRGRQVLCTPAAD